jgi:hypothetical protein
VALSAKAESEAPAKFTKSPVTGCMHAYGLLGDDRRGIASKIRPDSQDVPPCSAKPQAEEAAEMAAEVEVLPCTAEGCPSRQPLCVNMTCVDSEGH